MLTCSWIGSLSDSIVKWRFKVDSLSRHAIRKSFFQFQDRSGRCSSSLNFCPLENTPIGIPLIWSGGRKLPLGVVPCFKFQCRFGKVFGKATVSEIIWNLDPYSACLTALLSGVKQIQSLSDQVRGSFQKKLKLSLGRRLGTWNIMTPQKIKVNFLVCTETSNESRRVLLCGTKKKCRCRREKRCRIRSSCCFHNSWFSTCKRCCKPLHQADANVEDRDYAGVSRVLKSVSLERFGTESTLDSWVCMLLTFFKWDFRIV